MAYYERKHFGIQEIELEFSSDAEKQSFDQIRSILSELPDKPYDDVTDYTLFRFLRFAGFDANKASDSMYYITVYYTDTFISKYT